MIIRYIDSELISCGFKKENRNTGYVYNRIYENMELVCFIEQNIRLYFFIIYRWDNNRVRGSYCISAEDLKNYPDFASFLFKNALRNMPRCIGKEINVHNEILKMIKIVFNEK